MLDKKVGCLEFNLLLNYIVVLIHDGCMTAVFFSNSSLC